METLLKVTDLRTWFDTGGAVVRAVDGVSFEVRRGETFALLGESGCGKSMTALSIMRLVPQPAGRIAGGSIELRGEDLLRLPELAMRRVRGRRIGMIFQEPMTSLNPVLGAGAQIQEAVELHTPLRRRAARDRVLELLDLVGIPEPRQRVDDYPHQLSGGMKQRVMIAMALAGEPELLIADEPTTALDVTIQAQVLDVLAGLKERTGMSMLLITHDLGVVSEMADRVAVMYAGQIVEQAPRGEFFAHPQHPYSRKLFEALPTRAKRARRLAVIRGSVPALDREFAGCRFEPRCDYAWDECRNRVPAWTGRGEGSGVRCHLASNTGRDGTPVRHDEAAVPGARRDSGAPLLRVERLQVHFPVRAGLLQRTVGHVRAVDGVDLEIAAGRTLALVGESGCGKTTVGKAILRLIDATGGRVQFENLELTALGERQLRPRRGDFQIIFQDPFSSLNPRMRVAEIIEEGMLAQGRGGDRAQRQARIDELLGQVGLSPEVRHRYPHEFSGGQRQRLAIARALAVEPRLIVCDEPTSALDVSVQAQILNLLQRLQDELGLAYLFITHNLSVVEYLAHDVAVMYLGRIVEKGPVEQVLQSPRHPYTRALLAAVPKIEGMGERTRLGGELPSPLHPPAGCHFHPRCPHVMDRCRQTYPAGSDIGDGHTVRCYLFGE